MIKAKAMAVMSPTAPFTPYSFERRSPNEHDIVIDIKYCGVCHSDIHMAKSEWFPGIYPMVPGHEIAGVVSDIGTKVTKYKIGDHVGVGCFVDSCRTCENCKSDLDNYCLEGHTLTYGAFERDGKTVTYGGYSNVIVVNQDYVLKIPESIPLDKAAPLLCAGITTYSPLVHWKAAPGKKVAILGMGGLGHMAVKIASALGAEVTVLSHSDKKLEDAMQMGARNFIVTKNAESMQKYKCYFDLIINTVSSADLNMSDYFNLLKLDATLVSLGAPSEPLSINPFPLILMRRNYAGSVIGSIKETQAMLDFCAKHNITPEIEVISPNQIETAYERILQSNVRYRFVIDMQRL